MNAAERWLREHLPTAPPGLLAEMTSALHAASASVPDDLAAGALRLYQSVVEGPEERAAALPLLAADALFTHAFQAQAELDPDGISQLALRWGGAGELGTLAHALPARADPSTLTVRSP